EPGDVESLVLEVALGERDAERHAVGRDGVVADDDLLGASIRNDAERRQQRTDQERARAVHSGFPYLGRAPWRLPRRRLDGDYAPGRAGGPPQRPAGREQLPRVRHPDSVRKRALPPFHTICTPMHRRMNALSRSKTVIPVSPIIRLSRSA